MSIPRPKILTRVTVPTGGWAWDIDISKAAQYDTSLQGTIAAGDYFVSGDNQADDLLYALQTSVQAAITAASVSGTFIACIDEETTSHKVRFGFFGSGFVDATGDNDVRLNRSAWATGLCAALGMTTADEASTATDNPFFTASWHHGYGFYCDEDGQGQLVNPVGRLLTSTGQGVAPMTGHVKSIYYGDRYTNALTLQFLERYEQGRTKVFSDGIGYGAAPIHPYNRNEPLECWFMEAMQGIEFRVYNNARIDRTVANDTGSRTGVGAQTLTDAAKSWAVEPFRWKGAILYTQRYFESASYDVLPQSFYVSSHTGTVLTVPTSHPSGGGPASQSYLDYYLFDHQYGTYVLDISGMAEFNPTEHKAIDRWDLTIPLLRYEA